MTASTYKISGGPDGRLLGQRHLAYLRAVAEGLPIEQAAARYLGYDAHDGVPALRRQHKALVEQVQAQVRRQGDTAWRLVGLVIKPLTFATPAAPPIDVWSEASGLTDFGHAERLALYAEAFPQDRRALRNSRLRKRQLALLQGLATTVADAALPHHRLDDWLPAHLCRSLQAVGMTHLADLQTRIQTAGRWWDGIPKIGAGKAEWLRAQMALLLPGTASQPQAAGPVGIDDGPGASVARRGAAVMAAIQASAGPASPQDTDRASSLAGDTKAIATWIATCAGSAATTKSYRRELGRFMLFLDQQGLALGTCQSADCQAYVALLKNPPPGWTGKRTAPVGHAAWRPFAGPLSERSQQHAAAVLTACFNWLAANGHLKHNPWAQQDKAPAGDRGSPSRPSRSGLLGLPTEWQATILSRLAAWAMTEPGAERAIFVLQILGATGLRAQELLDSRLADLQWVNGQWHLQLRGPGHKRRQLALSLPAVAALHRYLTTRGLALMDGAGPADLPLLANLRDPKAPLTYRPLYGSLKTWLGKAIAASGLAEPARRQALRVNPLGLRLACASQALAHGMPVAAVAQWLGHANARTTAKYKGGWNGSTPPFFDPPVTLAEPLAVASAVRSQRLDSKSRPTARPGPADGQQAPGPA